MNEKWEYKKVHLSTTEPADLEKSMSDLNSLGKEGWEVVTTTTDGESYFMALLLKRRLA